MGSYEVCEAEGVKRGTKVVIHLKGDAHEFAKEEKIKGENYALILPYIKLALVFSFLEIIKKYSNFVGVPIFLNGSRVNTVQVRFYFCFA